jgi:prepilin-type N-terminal cleavage/methylation domain-containing protein/prepilin-type processing-associated H-X9-DG protein
MRSRCFFVAVTAIAASLTSTAAPCSASEWTFDFGTATGTSSFTTAGGTSSTFLPSPPAGGGSAFVRVGTGGGGFTLSNPGLAGLGQGTELAITAPSSTSVNKFAVSGFTASPFYALNFSTLLSGTSGAFHVFVRTGPTFGNGMSFVSTENLTGLQFALGSAGVTTRFRSGTSVWSGSGLSTTGITTGTVMNFSLYGNNAGSAAVYQLGGTAYTLGSRTWDLWLHGTRIGAALASSGLAAGNLDAFMFYGASSPGNDATMRLDEIRYSNALPVPEPHAAMLAAIGVALAGAGIAVRKRHGAATAMRGLPPRRSSRAAFSLVELLVVIAILGLLVALLLPAAQAAREAARRTACSGNLKQIALAVIAYESANGRLPAAAIVSEGNNTATCLGCWDPWAEARTPLDASQAPAKHGTGWMLEILPHVEQMAVFAAWDRSTNVAGNAAVAQTDIPTFYCPTRRGGIRTGSDDHLNLLDASWRGGGTDYGGCYGRLDGFVNDTASNHRFADRGTLGPSRLFDGPFLPNAGVALAVIRDGQSNTILLGEMQRLRPNGLPGAANTYNRTSYDGWAVGGVASLFVTATDMVHRNPGGMNNHFFESAGSDHPGGCSFAMADGSVQFLSEFIDAKDNHSVFPLLGSMRDGALASLATVGD